jgi:hypothetical protein
MSRCRRSELELKARLHLVALAAVHPHRAAGVHAGDPSRLWRDMLVSFPGSGGATCSVNVGLTRHYPWPHAPTPWHRLGTRVSCPAAHRGRGLIIDGMNLESTKFFSATCSSAAMSRAETATSSLRFLSVSTAVPTESSQSHTSSVASASTFQ